MNGLALSAFGLTPEAIARHVIAVAKEDLTTRFSPRVRFKFKSPQALAKYRAKRLSYTHAYRARFLAKGLTTRGKERKNKLRPEIGLSRSHPEYMHRYLQLRKAEA